MRLSIQAQLNNWRHDLDVWKDVVEKAINVEAKTSQEPPFETKKIDSMYSKSYKLSVKKEKDGANWEYWDKDKAKPHNLSSANISWPQTQAFKI